MREAVAALPVRVEQAAVPQVGRGYLLMLLILVPESSVVP